MVVAVWMLRAVGFASLWPVVPRPRRSPRHRHHENQPYRSARAQAENAVAVGIMSSYGEEMPELWQPAPQCRTELVGDAGGDAAFSTLVMPWCAFRWCGGGEGDRVVAPPCPPRAGRRDLGLRTATTPRESLPQPNGSGRLRVAVPVERLCHGTPVTAPARRRGLLHDAPGARRPRVQRSADLLPHEEPSAVPTACGDDAARISCRGRSLRAHRPPPTPGFAPIPE